MATVLETVQVGLKRGGLSETNSTYKLDGLTYLNAVIKEIEGQATWWWKFKTGTITTTKTMTLSGIGSSEQYAAGDTITGSSSSATATVVSHTAGESTLTFKSESGTFTTSDTVSGTSSGDLGTYVSDTATRLYDGASTVPVQSLVSAFNETSNNVLGIERPRIIQRYDPDLSDSGTPCFLYPWGINDSGLSNSHYSPEIPPPTRLLPTSIILIPQILQKTTILSRLIPTSIPPCSLGYSLALLAY